jgi:ammonium transporter, Amt family
MKSLMKRVGPGGLAALMLIGSVGTALAQEATAVEAEAVVAAEEIVLNTGDTAWMLTATALVLLMTIPGLALFYAGMVRKKNLLATAMQSFATCALMSVLWMVAGYSIAFGDGGALNDYVGNLDNLFLQNLTSDAMSGTIPESLFMVFQMTFAIITPALITGAFADRMKFSAMLIFLAVWMLIVYAPITHWVWGGGFLGQDGVLDYAGGTVVHINAGIAGLVLAIMLGKRSGYGSENMAPHNLTFSLIGASLLWVGWFGFNAGSALGANGSAAMAMVVTQIASAGAALTWMFLEWALRGKPSVLGIISGAIGGLVAITPASGFVAPGGALMIGIAAGAACYWGAVWLKPKLGYDDSLDVFGVHGIGGIVGALLTGVFAREAIGGASGLIEGNAGQVWTQFVGIVSTIIYSGVISVILFKIIDLTVGMRVSPEDERSGLDLALHGESIQ